LGGAVDGFVRITGIGDGNSTYYTIEEANKFEVGIGTYSSAANTLSRDEVFISSNAGNKVNLGGSGTVFITYPADKAVFKTSGNYVGIGIDPEYQLQVSGTGSFDTVRFADGTTQTTSQTSDINTISGLVVTNTTSIATNTGDIAILSGSVATNTTNISTNTSNIHTTGTYNYSAIQTVSGLLPNIGSTTISCKGTQAASGFQTMYVGYGLQLDTAGEAASGVYDSAVVTICDESDFVPKGNSGSLAFFNDAGRKVVGTTGLMYYNSGINTVYYFSNANSGDFRMKFNSAAGITPITLRVDEGTDSHTGTMVSFEGSEGTLLSMVDNVSTGSLFTVSDIAGLPLIEANSSGDVKLLEYGNGRYVGIGTGTPQYKLDVNGPAHFASGVSFVNDLSYVDVSGNAYFQNILANGNLTVSGTLTYIDSTTVTIADKQLELASNSGTAIGNDSAVDDGGIVLKSTDSDKKWTWQDSTDAWHSTENISLASSKSLTFGDGSTQTTAATGAGAGVTIGSTTFSCTSTQAAAPFNSLSISSGLTLVSGVDNNFIISVCTTGIDVAAISVGSNSVFIDDNINMGSGTVSGVSTVYTSGMNMDPSITYEPVVTSGSGEVPISTGSFTGVAIDLNSSSGIRFTAAKSSFRGGSTDFWNPVSMRQGSLYFDNAHDGIRFGDNTWLLTSPTAADGCCTTNTANIAATGATLLSSSSTNTSNITTIETSLADITGCGLSCDGVAGSWSVPGSINFSGPFSNIVGCNTLFTDLVAVNNSIYFKCGDGSNARLACTGNGHLNIETGNVYINNTYQTGVFYDIDVENNAYFTNIGINQTNILALLDILAINITDIDIRIQAILNQTAAFFQIVNVGGDTIYEIDSDANVNVSGDINASGNIIMDCTHVSGVSGITFCDGSEIGSGYANITGVLTANTGIVLQRNIPVTTTDKLYNVGGSLYFNGSAIDSTTPIATGARIDANTANIHTTGATLVIGTGLNRGYIHATGATNAALIATNTTNITSNASNIHTTGVTLIAGTGLNRGYIHATGATNAALIATNTTNIATNASNIHTTGVTLIAGTGLNRGYIHATGATNAALIASNTTNITSNASNIHTTGVTLIAGTGLNRGYIHATGTTNAADITTVSDLLTTYTAGTGVAVPWLGIGTATATYDLDVAGNIGVDEYIYHNGDDNTYIRFQDDSINIYAGGRQMIKMDEASTDKITINNGGMDVDLQIKGENNANLLRTDAENDRIGIGHSSPSYILDVDGTGNFRSGVRFPDGAVQTGAFTAASGALIKANTASISTNTSNIHTTGATNAAAVAANAAATINYGGISLALGGSDTTPAFDLSDATAYPSKSLVPNLVAESDGATITFDLNDGNTQGVTLGDNRTLAISNEVAGQKFMLRLLQDGTGGRTVTWFSTIKWAGGSAPTLTTTASKADVFGFLCTAADTYDGFVVGQNI